MAIKFKGKHMHVQTAKSLKASFGAEFEKVGDEKYFGDKKVWG